MTGAPNRSRQAQAKAWREAGIAAARAGNKVRARRCLRQSIAFDDEVEETWLWLAGVAATPQESERHLRRALAINPHSRRAKAGLHWAQRKMSDQETGSQLLAAAGREDAVRPGPPSGLVSTPEPSPSRSYDWKYWAGAVLAVWLLVLLAGGYLMTTLGVGDFVMARPSPTPTPVPGTPTPTTLQRIAALHMPLQAAWETKDWPECLRVLEQIQTLDSHYPGLDEWLVAVHLAWGQELVAQAALEEAVVHFDAVRALDRDEQTAQEQRLLALAYLAAQESYTAGDWERAIFQLEAVLGLDNNYHDARDLLYQAYYQQGRVYQTAAKLEAAKRSYEQALAVKGEGEEARAALDKVVFLLTPPTPTPTPKRIEIYIGQQRMYVYEGERLIWNWVVSTGEVGRPTRTGHFKVLDKIPNAYASRWDLQMPHWLGIYYAGASENGIHALPILSNGQRLWEGYLGRRVSYGCVILGVEEARLLYEWADVGTPVDIYP
jgi:lipoprotein-anchoring transpeptidase ErfK/SrfK